MHTHTHNSSSSPLHPSPHLSLSLSVFPWEKAWFTLGRSSLGVFYSQKEVGGGWDTIFCLIVHIVAAFQTDTLSWHVYLFVLRTQKLHLSWGTVGAMTAFAVQLAGLPARQLKLLPSKGALYTPRESKCHCRPSGSAPTTLDLSCHLFSLLSILWLDQHKG